MIVSQVCLWPFAAVAGGTVVVATLRCLMLFIGLRLTLRGAPRDHRLPIYREFARALSFTPRHDEDPSESADPSTPSQHRHHGHTRFLRRPEKNLSRIEDRMVAK